MKTTLFMIFWIGAFMLHAQDDMNANVEGTWLFVSAMAGDKDITDEYPQGMVDGKAQTMTLEKGGKMVFSDALVYKLNLGACTWSLEKREDTGVYYLITTLVFKDGMEANSREKIRVADGKKLIFGKRTPVEYVRVD